MIGTQRWFVILLVCLCVFFAPTVLRAQSVANSTTIEGTVTDPSGAVVAKATVTIHNPISGFERSTATDASGNFSIPNVPFNPYHLTVTAVGFAPYAQDVEVRSTVPLNLKINLKLAGTSASVTVEGEAADLLETNATAHTDVDRALFEKLPLESISSSLSSLVTLATPGVVADSNGLFHALGDHAENQFSVDGQPITDQQSKVFSNQLPVDAVQSMEVINGILPAEFGDKNSLAIRVTTRSGLGQSGLHGGVTGEYGSFGTSSAGFNLGFGSSKWGNFITASGLNTGRFLDPPEFQVIHAKGNGQNVFDRIDLQPRQSDTFHLNLGYSRSWFQTPNTFDQGAANQDQRSLLRTINVAPGWTHLFNAQTLLTVNGFFRRDHVGYFPSGTVANGRIFNDQPVSIAQDRFLTNGGIRADISYVKGIHNAKIGVQYTTTPLTEAFNFGITDPTFNAVCLLANGNPDPSPTPTNPSQCSTARPGDTPNPNFVQTLLPFDLTRAGTLFRFPGGTIPGSGHTDIKEEAVYLMDDIRAGNWSFNVGIRGDNYNGVVHSAWAQPRLGVAYNIKATNTVLRLGYGKFFETPFNENLVLSNSTGIGGLTAALGGTQPLHPGRRNQFNAGFQQAIGRYLVVDGEYFWKYTKNAFDFDVLLSTPVAFPIEWRKSKIDGAAIRVTVPNFHGLTAFSVLGHSRARFFGPEVGGIIFNSPVTARVFRIDHDEAFASTVHVQYQPKKTLPWAGFNWRYDSGLVAGAVGSLADALGLTADQQAAIGFFCGNVFAMPTRQITSCPVGTPFGATRLRIPAAGTANDDLNPPRIAPRHLFDVAVGMDNIFHGDRYKWNLRLTVVNLTNEVALYNFLSTFSGTHFVTPRAYTGQIGFNF